MPPLVHALPVLLYLLLADGLQDVQQGGDVRHPQPYGELQVGQHVVKGLVHVVLDDDWDAGGHDGGGETVAPAIAIRNKAKRCPPVKLPPLDVMIGVSDAGQVARHDVVVKRLPRASTVLGLVVADAPEECKEVLPALPLALQCCTKCLLGLVDIGGVIRHVAGGHNVLLQLEAAVLLVGGVLRVPVVVGHVRVLGRIDLQAKVHYLNGVLDQGFVIHPACPKVTGQPQEVILAPVPVVQLWVCLPDVHHAPPHKLVDRAEVVVAVVVEERHVEEVGLVGVLGVDRPVM
mmetsp:Transcript_22736/g.49794  ORF Transcript_22736/g.49794 Transcript_22736/m.49794 type:complete len:289 (-) Transcript_22736:648-1514(-)